MTMYIFKIITLLGGLALFLFGMDIMGKSLERTAGGKLHTILAKMSSTVFRGFLLGMAVTAVIQSSSATTVMVVGFVNSGIMTLNQAVGVIMGSNIGTTVTAWLLSLTAGLPVMGMILFFMTWAILETNFSSNIVTTTVVSAVALSVLTAACVFLPYWKLIGLV